MFCTIFLFVFPYSQYLCLHSWSLQCNHFLNSNLLGELWNVLVFSSMLTTYLCLASWSFGLLEVFLYYSFHRDNWWIFPQKICTKWSYNLRSGQSYYILFRIMDIKHIKQINPERNYHFSHRIFYIAMFHYVIGHLTWILKGSSMSIDAPQFT